MKETINFSLPELKEMLFDIKEHGPKTCVRFRLLGKMWQKNFVRIIALDDDRILVNDENGNKLISVNMNEIVQFEIDHTFKSIEPHFHYDVVWNKNHNLKNHQTWNL